MIDPLLILNPYSLFKKDFRGRFNSEGDFSVWRKSGVDTADTIEWIRQQSWSTGLVVQYGYSADGISEVLSFTEEPAPEGLSAQFIIAGTGDVYDSLFNNGLYRQSLTDGWLSFLGETASIPEVYMNEQYGEWWFPADLSRDWYRADVPAVHQGGWFDIFNQGSLDTFRGYQKKGGEGAIGEQYLVMATGGHCQGLGEKFPNEEFGAQLATEMAMFVYGKGLTGHEFPSPYSAVNLYIMGPFAQTETGNFWACMDEFPEKTRHSLYLRNDGSLSESPARATDQRRRRQSKYTYDPSNPVPTMGGPNLLLECGPMDQTAVEQREDVLVFTSDVLEEDMAVVGKVMMELYASSSAQDTDFMVKLTDVYPTGESYNVLDSGIRARWRNGKRRDPSPLVPGRAEMFEIDMLSTAHVFAAGHQVRLTVTSSNAPRYSVNYNNYKFLVEDPASEPIVAENTIYHSKNRPSRVILPMVNLEDLKMKECYSA